MVGNGKNLPMQLRIALEKIRMLPVYTVEKPGFVNLLKQFDPQYELPSRKYFSKTAIPKLYEST